MRNSPNQQNCLVSSLSTPTRRAFTLIELLVVIAIIAVLLGLMLPAVQKVRESVNRTECANNLKQMCLAAHGHVETFGRFPSAYQGEGTQPGWSWGTQLLPFLEQEGIHSQMGADTQLFGGGANPAMPTTPTQTVLGVFICPSDEPPEYNPIRLNFPTSNYRAVAGPRQFPTFNADQDLGGIMFQNSAIRPASIKDGLSNTLLIGECIYDEAQNKWGAIWPGMTGLRNENLYYSDVLWWVDEESAVINGPASQAFSSRHPKGAQFAFADGSVRMFREGGNVDNLRWMAGRNDGVLVNQQQ